MSKPTVSAAGGAMPAEGHKTRRAAALALFEAAPALAILPAAAGPPSTTQLAALIEAHRAARAAFLAAIDPLEAAEPDEETVIPGFGDCSYPARQRKDDIAKDRTELRRGAQKDGDDIGSLSGARRAGPSRVGSEEGILSRPPR